MRFSFSRPGFESRRRKVFLSRIVHAQILYATRCSDALLTSDTLILQTGHSSSFGIAMQSAKRKLLSCIRATWYVRSQPFSANTASPVVEVREYQIQCESINKWLIATEEFSDVRKSLVPLRLFCSSDTGTSLNLMSHFYYYEGGMQQREEGRTPQARNVQWQEYLRIQRLCVLEQRSSIFVEAPLVRENNLSGFQLEVLDSSSSHSVIYEIRRYQLKLGYDTVPRFLQLYGQGLPSKLSAEGTDPTTSLCSLLYSEVGDLNHVIEVWRHGDGAAAMNRSRVAARSAVPWREAIAAIAELAVNFNSSIHRPLKSSNWQ